MNILKSMFLLYCILIPMISVRAENIVHQTFAMIKPYAVKKGLTNDILNIIQEAGFTIIAMKEHLLTTVQVEQLYEDRKNNRWFPQYLEAMISSPALLLILEKENAVIDWDYYKKMIRLQYASICKKNNIVHGSESINAAEREIALFFK